MWKTAICLNPYSNGTMYLISAKKDIVSIMNES